MSYPTYHYYWQWQLRASPDVCWALVSNTNRFNYDTGLSSIHHLPGDGHLQNRRRRLGLFASGIPVEWDEEPFEWIRPYRFGVIRRYNRGPIGEMRMLAELTELPEGGTWLVYQVWITPSNVLGLMTIPFNIGVLTARNFDRVFRMYDEMAVSGQLHLDFPGKVSFAPGGNDRLAAARDRLLANGNSPALVDRLTKTVGEADDLTVGRLRPYILADHWAASRSEMLQLCLHATRAGMLDCRWDVLCPYCRGAQQRSPTLSGVRSTVHCGSCNIDFSVNFDQFVELTFRASQAIRRVDDREFCIGGPQVTPHIEMQCLLPAGSEKSMTLKLDPGRHRLRTLGLPGGALFTAGIGGQAETTFRAADGGWIGDEVHVNQAPVLHLENSTDSEQLFVVERMAWSDQAATAAEVTALQSFRDLFVHQNIPPGDHLSVGNLTVVFTDLRGSTRLYQEVGDAPALDLVMEHFDVLREAIADEGGAVVKTIGDAVMAVFRRPAPALRAMLNAQRKLAAPESGHRPLALKVGMHFGPCIAITLNDRLDYFGTSVNLASRLESLSTGTDIVVSGDIKDDVEVAAFLSDEANQFLVAQATVIPRDFEDQLVNVWRVVASDLPDAGPQLSLSDLFR